MQDENIIDQFETYTGETYRLILTAQGQYLIKRNYLMLHIYDIKEEAQVKFEAVRDYFKKTGMIKTV